MPASADASIAACRWRSRTDVLDHDPRRSGAHLPASPSCSPDRDRGKLLTIVTKSNAQRHAHGDVGTRSAPRSRASFPDVTWDKMLVDAMTMRMTIKPESLDTNRRLEPSCRHSVRSGGGAGGPRWAIAPTANLNPERRFSPRCSNQFTGLGVRHCRQGESPIRSARSGLER